MIAEKYQPNTRQVYVSSNPNAQVHFNHPSMQSYQGIPQNLRSGLSNVAALPVNQPAAYERVPTVENYVYQYAQQPSNQMNARSTNNYGAFQGGNIVQGGRNPAFAGQNLQPRQLYNTSSQVYPQNPSVKVKTAQDTTIPLPNNNSTRKQKSNQEILCGKACWIISALLLTALLTLALLYGLGVIGGLPYTKSSSGTSGKVGAGNPNSNNQLTNESQANQSSSDNGTSKNLSNATTTNQKQGKTSSKVPPTEPETSNTNKTGEVQGTTSVSNNPNENNTAKVSGSNGSSPSTQTTNPTLPPVPPILNPTNPEIINPPTKPSYIPPVPQILNPTNPEIINPPTKPSYIPSVPPILNPTNPEIINPPTKPSYIPSVPPILNPTKSEIINPPTKLSYIPSVPPATPYTGNAEFDIDQNYILGNQVKQ